MAVRLPKRVDEASRAAVSLIVKTHALSLPVGSVPGLEFARLALCSGSPRLWKAGGFLVFGDGAGRRLPLPRERHSHAALRPAIGQELSCGEDEGRRKEGAAPNASHLPCGFLGG